MKCQQIDEYINLYLDGLISEEQTKELNQHIKECEKCKEAFLVIKNAKNVIDSDEESELPKKFHKDLMGKISTLKTDDKKIIKFPFYKIAAVAAAFAITVFACYNFTADDFGKGVDISGLETKETVNKVKEEKADIKEEKPQITTEEKNENKIDTKEVVKTVQPEVKKETPVAEVVKSNAQPVKEPEVKVIFPKEEIVVTEEPPIQVTEEQTVQMTEEQTAQVETVSETTEDTQPVYNEVAEAEAVPMALPRMISEEEGTVAFSGTESAYDVLCGLGFGTKTGEKTFEFDISESEKVMEALSHIPSDGYSVEATAETLTVTCF